MYPEIFLGTQLTWETGKSPRTNAMPQNQHAHQQLYVSSPVQQQEPLVRDIKTPLLFSAE